MNAGATILSNANQIYDVADIITKIRPPDMEEVPKLAGKTVISTIQPAINTDLYKQLADQNTNVFALDCVPRMLSRGQSYDTLSSQANIAGYRAGELEIEIVLCIIPFLITQSYENVYLCSHRSCRTFSTILCGADDSCW
jgi:NAD/NADP transhydrogenase alpha subunit